MSILNSLKRVKEAVKYIFTGDTNQLKQGYNLDDINQITLDQLGYNPKKRIFPDAVILSSLGYSQKTMNGFSQYTANRRIKHEILVKHYVENGTETVEKRRAYTKKQIQQLLDMMEQQSNFNHPTYRKIVFEMASIVGLVKLIDINKINLDENPV